MFQTVSAPDWSYVIACTRPDGSYHETFKIDQALALPKGNRAKELLGNSIDQYLHDLHRKTGFGYSVIYEGNPEMAQAILEQEETCPF